MSTDVDGLGLIAGNRTLPLEFARLARARGVRRLVAVAFRNETDPRLEDLVDEVVWLRVGQLSKMISAFVKRDIRRCVMVGQIAPKNLYDLRPDLRAMALLMRIKERNAQTLFGAIATELEKEGVALIEATPWLGPLMPGPGFRVGPAVRESTEDDIRFGLKIAREVSMMEIGQTVVVKEGTVLAVEAFEGTDRCLARGGDLAGAKGGAVAVKLAKSGHDPRFDIPCIGTRTVSTCADHGVATLACEAGRVLLLERDRVEKLARERKVSLVTID